MICTINKKDYRCEFEDRPIVTGDWVGVIPSANNKTEYCEIRHVTSTKPVNVAPWNKGKYFYDDGKVSGQEPCASCGFKDYKPLKIDFK